MSSHLSPSARRFTHILTSLLSAALLTWALNAWDDVRVERRLQETGERWARQIITQFESMALHAEGNGEIRPHDFAVEYLTQGQESRILEMKLITGEEFTAPQTSLKREWGQFEFIKPIGDRNSRAIRVVLNLGYIGFLGTSSIVGADFSRACVGALFFLVFFFGTSRIFGFQDREKYLNFRNWVAGWTNESRQSLMDLGGGVKGLLQESHNMILHAQEAHVLIQTLREKIHERARIGFPDEKFLKSTLGLAELTHEFAKSAREKPVPSTLAKTELAAQKLTEAAQKIQQKVLHHHHSLEPWTVDADLAFESQKQLLLSAEALKSHIHQTRSHLLGQARLIQELKLEMDPEKKTAA